MQVAGITQPYVPHVGSTCGVSGLIGESAVELCYAWKILKKPYIEAIKLVCFYLFIFLMSLLPYISLMGNVAALGFGAICALIFMPVITFDR